MASLSGDWSKTHSLTEERQLHSSWQKDDGTTILMGGRFSRTTEIVSDSSAVGTPGFRLKYETT